MSILSISNIVKKLTVNQTKYKKFKNTNFEVILSCNGTVLQ